MMDDMAQDARDRLIRMLSPLDTATREPLEGGLTSEQATLAASLLEELDALSQKAARAAREALPDFVRRGLLTVATGWLDLGIAITETSGAAALRYFRESPLLLGLLPPDSRHSALAAALDLCERHATLALDFIRVAPELLPYVLPGDLKRWTDLVDELAAQDYVIGVELLRQAPAAARIFSADGIRDWVAVGMKLVTTNSLGKTDYVGTLEYFRTSPGLLDPLASMPVRQAAVRVASALADRDPASAGQFIAEVATLLQPVTDEHVALRLLQYGVLVAERDPMAAVAYFRRAPDFLALSGTAEDAKQKFDAWFGAGMEVLGYSPEGARAYFAWETRKALASVEEAISAVRLREVARALGLFAEGLCGRAIRIAAAPASGMTPGSAPNRPRVSEDGHTIVLPDLINRTSDREANRRWYLVMTAHEAGHLEFGTYAVSLDDLHSVVADVAARYGMPASPVKTLAELFERYPQPALIRDLWTVLEDARVEQHLRHHYPGLRGDLRQLAEESIRTRSLSEGFTARELVVDALLLMTSAEPGTFRIPDSLTDVVEEIWRQCRPSIELGASATAAIHAAHAAYVLMDERLAPRESAGRGPGTETMNAGPAASDARPDAYRSVDNFLYRGDMQPDLVRRPTDTPEGAMASRPASTAGADARTASEARGDTLGETAMGGRRPAGAVDEWLDVPSAPLREGRHAGEAFVYDEWDGTIADYRTGWCRVREVPVPAAGADFVDRVLVDHGAGVRVLRRYFEALRPSGLRRLPGRRDGDELDLDAVVRWAAERGVSSEEADRLYVRRERHERQVAVAFVLDLSGSTGRRIEGGGQTILDVEKESLVLLCQALQAVGDQYGIYGYSGQGRQQVDVFTLKDFDDAHASAMDRLGGLIPQAQNRDGAAIRHVTRKLLSRDAKVRLLVLLNDGKPLDDGYTDEYALEDTKMALREARAGGIHPFCITVDRDADDYLRRMYGDVQYLIVDHAAALSERLPRIYQRLTR